MSISSLLDVEQERVADIFISYSKRDPQLTIDLAKDLEARGYTTWWDSSLLPGDEFPEKIREELNKARAVIVIWTPASIVSSWVKAEAFIANDQNKLITLRSFDLDPRSIPLPYNIRHAALVTDREAIYAALGQHEGLIPYGDGLSAELIGLRQDFDDAIRSASNITGYMADLDVPRFDITDVDIRYVVRKNGDTEVKAFFGLDCVKARARVWTYWIEADAESTEIKSLRQLNFQVVDVENEQTLAWLLTHNTAKAKVLAIFFPEITPGTRKSLRISYFWPGYMKKLIELGTTNFGWRYVTQNPDRRARFRTEWEFDGELAPLECRIIGNPSESASLRLEPQADVFAWVYEDPSAVLRPKYAVEFFDRRVGEN